MWRPDLWLRKYLAGLLYAVLELPTALLDALTDVYEALWRPVVDLIDHYDYDEDEDDEEDE